MPHVFLNGSFAHTYTQLEQLASDALCPPKPIRACHLFDQYDRLWGELRLSRISP
jgi:hypothetical protein